MPLLRNAKKKQRQDKKRTLNNLKVKSTFKRYLKEAKTPKKTEDVNLAFSSIDKAVKKHILHKNKAARMKSTLSKSLLPKSA